MRISITLPDFISSYAVQRDTETDTFTITAAREVPDPNDAESVIVYNIMLQDVVKKDIINSIKILFHALDNYKQLPSEPENSQPFNFRDN